MSPDPAPAAAGAGARSAARPPRRWLRRALPPLAVLLLALLLVVLTAPWWFDARRVATIALDRAGAATNLDWRIEGEPELRWRPRPWLALPGLEVSDAQGRLVLGAERLELALPWTTLRGESLRIEAIRLDGPRINLDAALEWWNAQPPDEAASMPELDGLLVSDGRIRWGATRIDGLELSLPHFAIGQPMRLLATGRVTLPAKEAGATAAAPFDISIDLHAMPQAGPLRLEALQLALSGSGPVPAAQATGRLQFAPWQLALDGALAAWPAVWPALPAPISASTAPLAFTLTQDGESARAAEAALTLSRDDAHVEARLQPAALLGWLDSDSAAVLPPIAAKATLPSLDIDGIRLEGISIAIDEVAPGAEAAAADGAGRTPEAPRP